MSHYDKGNDRRLRDIQATVSTLSPVQQQNIAILPFWMLHIFSAANDFLNPNILLPMYNVKRSRNCPDPSFLEAQKYLRYWEPFFILSEPSQFLLMDSLKIEIISCSEDGNVRNLWLYMCAKWEALPYHDNYMKTSPHPLLTILTSDFPINLSNVAKLRCK